MRAFLVLSSLVLAATLLLPSVVLSSEEGLFKELCLAEYTLKKDLDTIENREVVHELDLEYQDVMARRIALGLKLSIFQCAPEWFEQIELNDSNRRSVELMTKQQSPETLSAGQAVESQINSELKENELVKLGPQMVERSEKRMHYFNKLCELEYETKRRADVSWGALFNQYWKLYNKSANTRISLGHSLNIPHCPREAWIGRKLQQSAASKSESDCIRAIRAKTMCAKFTKAVVQDHYDLYPEAVHLMNTWCELEKLFAMQKNQVYNAPDCFNSKQIEREAEDMVKMWLLLVEAEEVAATAEKEKGTYVGQPLRVLNRIESDEDELGPKMKKKTKLFNFTWFSNKKKQRKSGEYPLHWDQKKVLKNGDEDVFKQFCVREYQLKDDLDTNKNEQLISDLEREYLSIMGTRIALGQKLGLKRCPPSLVNLDSEADLNTKREKYLSSCGSAEERNKAEVKLAHFESLCSLELGTKRKVETAESSSSRYALFFDLYRKVINLRKTLSNSMSGVDRCGQSHLNEAPTELLDIIDDKCSVIQRAQVMCSRFGEAILDEKYSKSKEIGNLRNDWCGREKSLVETKKKMKCDSRSVIESESKTLAEDWLLLVGAQELVGKLKKN